MGMHTIRRKPAWLRTNRLAVGPEASRILNIIRSRGLHTVCTSASCPNKGTCFAEGTATFLILGPTCTRGCAFCDVDRGVPHPPDPNEPARVAEAAAAMDLRFVVITSVCRDDLPDEGADMFTRTIRAVRARLPEAGIEVLVPDFSGRETLLGQVLAADPNVFNHNIETVERLTPRIRVRAEYRRSLGVLASAKRVAPSIPTKSGLMVGLGENEADLDAAFADLAEVGVERLTIGQYLQPSRSHPPVRRYVPPEDFEALAERARDAGIPHVLSGPLVRSSYHAADFPHPLREIR